MSNLFFSFPPPLLSLPLPCPFLSFFFLVKVKNIVLLFKNLLLPSVFVTGSGHPPVEITLLSIYLGKPRDTERPGFPLTC